MRVDAHLHVWRLADAGRDWPPPGLAPLYRDFTLADAAPLLRAHGIARAVLVQSLPREDDTLALLALAADHDVVGAVVGWTDLKAPDAPRRIAALAARPKLRGLRPMLQDLPDGAWLDDPALDRAMGAMTAHGLAFDALVRPHQLPALARFAARFPDLQVVIDHAAKPALASNDVAAWRRDLRALARLPNVACKLSGLVTEADPGWQPRDLAPCVAELLDGFGAQRLLWGSDWPVLNLAADYDRWLGACDDLLAGLADDDRAAVFGLNACRIYRLHRT